MQDEEGGNGIKKEKRILPYVVYWTKTNFLPLFCSRGCYLIRHGESVSGATSPVFDCNSEIKLRNKRHSKIREKRTTTVVLIVLLPKSTTVLGTISRN